MSLADLDRRIDYLESRLIRAEREIAMRPVRPPHGSASQSELVLYILDGATVYSNGGTTYYGITKSGSSLTTVSSLWNVSTGTDTPGSWSCTDTGIGRAILYKNAVRQAGYVLVCHDTRAGNLIGQALGQGDVAGTFLTTTLTLASDNTQNVTAYIPTYL